jgi:hypothetical protein
MCDRLSKETKSRRVLTLQSIVSFKLDKGVMIMHEVQESGFVEEEMFIKARNTVYTES